MSVVLETRKEHYDLYHYHPSVAAPIAFAVIFLILSITLFFRTIRHKIRFLIAFIIGAFLEVIGYIARAYSAHETPDWTLGPFIIQALALLLPPVFFAASIYMSLGRLIRAVHREDLSIIRPTLVTKIFVAGDIVSFLAQSAGGSMQSQKNPDAVKTGANIVTAGLAIQLLYFGFFIFVAFIFHLRTHRVGLSPEVHQAVGWKKNASILYLGSFLILIRSIYRTIEYAGGKDGYLMEHEAYFYIFDAALMTIVVAAYTFFLPKEISGIKRQQRGEELKSLEAGDSNSRMAR